MDVYLLTLKDNLHLLSLKDNTFIFIIFERLDPFFFRFLKSLSSHMACGILVLQLGLKPVFQQWKYGVLTTRPPAKFQCTFIFTCGLLGPYMFGDNLQECVITKRLNQKESPISRSVSFTNEEMMELRG